MDSQSLETASTYLNNLLLSRGLLRNGKPIEFAQPKNGPGGSEATMAKIINLVHDLVLRRDQEADQRECMASTIRTLRSTETLQGVEIERLRTKATDLTRAVSLAEGQERAFKSSLRNAEASARSLREQMQRMKSTLQQVRTQCANDIRKRDVQLQKLKTHLSGVQRGKRDAFGMSTITITPTASSATAARLDDGGEGIDSPGYTLKQESTEFLTKLCQNLSDENDALIGLARHTIGTLRNLQGLPTSGGLPSDQGTSRDGGESEAGEPMADSLVDAPPMSCDALSTEMDVILEHLRTLLTNPSFVPIEEVEVREDEIVRLREGWEKMEKRWREAMAMMDTWRRRIAQGGDSVNVDELRTGLSLGKSIAAYRHADNEAGTDSASSSAMFDVREDEEGAGAVVRDDTENEQSDAEDRTAPSPKYLRMSPKKPAALGEGSGNARLRPAVSPRKVSFEASGCIDSTSVEECESFDEMSMLGAGVTAEGVQRTLSKESKSMIPRQKYKNVSPPMTIQQKLAAVEAEALVAEEARKREEANHKRKPLKGNSRKKSNRRRSTLCPEELETLMGIH